jgi:hypothetical protein
MEGGLGDHFAANRFIPAIKELHPDCEITLYSDTEGKTKQSDILNRMWPSFFKDTVVIQNKKYKNFRIKSSNFPDEDHKGNIKNIPDDIHKEMTEDCDLFYDLHIDSLEWLNHDYDWFKRFNTFPKPETSSRMASDKCHFPDKFILAHLYARDDADSNMESWYINKLLKSITQEFDVVVLYDDESRHQYKDLMEEGNKKLHFMNESLANIFDISSRCSAMLGIDSGVRFIPYHYGKPVFTFSKYCKQYGVVQYSYLIRWLFNDRYVFPLHLDVTTAGQILKNCLRNPAYRLYPHLLDNIEQLVAQRDITEYITE